MAIEEGFKTKFPRCVGILEGKHIVVQCPNTKIQKYNTVEQSNFKRKYKMEILALVDSDYRFIFADIADPGSISPVGVFQNSSFWQNIESDTLNLPSDTPLPGRENNVPYVFLSSGPFPSYKHILRPFPGKHDSGTVQHSFNQKVSSTRLIFKNTFGVLSSNFGILRKQLDVDLRKVRLLTLTCILLHNFLRNSESSRNIYTPPGTFDSIVDGQHVDGSWRLNEIYSSSIKPIRHTARCESSDMEEVRSEFAYYFHNSE